MRSRLLVMFLLMTGAAWSADWEFDRVVHAVEHQYGVGHTHIPLMGVANFFVKVARPGGATGFKLAVFENLDHDRQDFDDLDRFMDGISQGGMHRLLRLHSNDSGEATYIYLGGIGHTTKMLLVTFERHEATVLQVNLNFEALMRMLSDPLKGRRDYCCANGST